MDVATLESLGFQFNCGAIDRDGEMWGTLTADGCALTPEGVDLVAKLMAEKTPAKTPAKKAKQVAEDAPPPDA